MKTDGRGRREFLKTSVATAAGAAWVSAQARTASSSAVRYEAQLAEVRRAQAETRRIFSVDYSERFSNGATVKAGDLVKAGAIGKVIQTVCLGPHRMTPKTRPAWFFERERYGGILCDIASHDFD